MRGSSWMGDGPANISGSRGMLAKGSGRTTPAAVLVIAPVFFFFLAFWGVVCIVMQPAWGGVGTLLNGGVGLLCKSVNWYQGEIK